MNLVPVKPLVNPDDFKQEYFRHPKYKLLNNEEKRTQRIEFVRKNILKAEKKLFDQFFPNVPLTTLLNDKVVLDIGCSLGGKTINCAERWKVSKMYGIDVDRESINALELFVAQAASLEVQYDFRISYAEALPFNNDTFDAIISYDTIEHVRSVKETISECKRVTKKGGLIFLVFPSYYFPFGGAHLASVTNTPFLEWLFDADTLNRALQEIKSDRDEDYSWYEHKLDSRYGDWASVKGGIGINGITYNKFNNIVHSVGFSKVDFMPTPLFRVSFVSNRYRVIKHLSNTLTPFIRIKLLVDYLSHRLVYILTV